MQVSIDGSLGKLGELWSQEDNMVIVMQGSARCRIDQPEYNVLCHPEGISKTTPFNVVSWRLKIIITLLLHIMSGLCSLQNTVWTLSVVLELFQKLLVIFTPLFYYAVYQCLYLWVTITFFDCTWSWFLLPCCGYNIQCNFPCDEHVEPSLCI